MRYTLLFILPFLFATCKTDKELAEVTYFSGKIVNPKATYVTLYKGGTKLDSVALYDENKFMFKLDTLTEGVYTFFHHDEYQYIFLKPNDSLSLHLNTWDFDESLVFSGTGAEQNNLFLNLFLMNEKEDKYFYDYYKLDNTAFLNKIDSLANYKKQFYKNFKENNSQLQLSNLYDKYIDALITYPLYRKKEYYPYMHSKRTQSKEQHQEINEQFYSYRKSIDFNDEELLAFYPFREYLRTYVNHIAYDKYITNEKNKPLAYYYLKEISDKITEQRLRNNLLDEAMWNLCMESEIDNSDLEEAKEIFYKNCDNKEIRNGIDNIIKAKDALPKNIALPELIVYNNSYNKISLNDVVKGHNAVIYFWPKRSRQVENLSKRVNYLEKKYPDILFVGINSKFPIKNWNAFVAEKQFNAKNQFLLNKQIKNNWLHFDYSRAIVVNKEGQVVDGFANISPVKFENQLKAFTK